MVGCSVVSGRRAVKILDRGVGEGVFERTRVTYDEFIETVVVDIATLQRAPKQVPLFCLSQVSQVTQARFITGIEIHFTCIRFRRAGVHGVIEGRYRQIIAGTRVVKDFNRTSKGLVPDPGNCCPGC